MSSDNREVSVRPALREHLNQIQTDPSTPLNTRLLDECEIGCLNCSSDTKIALINDISPLLSTLQQDPSPLIRLLLKLIEPFDFSEILSLAKPPDLAAGLDLSARPYHSVTLRILEKAAEKAAYAAILASTPDVIYALVNLWLRTSDVGIADQAGNVLVKLLTVDKEPSNVTVHGFGHDSAVASRGQGLVWRRVFGDKDIYELFFAACDSKHGDAKISRREKTISQARLMMFAVELGALDWTYLTRSHIADVENAYGLDPKRESFLDFIALHMVDYKDDVLIHINRTNFHANMIFKVTQRSQRNLDVSISLEYLMEKQLHHENISIWLKPDDPVLDPVNISFLYTPSAEYVSAYAWTYPAAFMDSQYVQPTLLRLCSSVNSLSENQWAQGPSPKPDLNVLVSVPRLTLLPQSYLGEGRRMNALFSIPCRSTNADALNALATVFRGPKHHKVRSVASNGEETIKPPGISKRRLGADKKAEAKAACAAYYAYLSYHGDFFKHLVTHADTVALSEKALAAINVMTSIADANWLPLPASGETGWLANSPPKHLEDVPSEEHLRGLLPRPENFPSRLEGSGFGAILQWIVVKDVFPYLLRGPRTFSNLSGGRGDPENGIYKIAMAKWDLTYLIYNKMKECRPESRTWEPWMMNDLEKRIAAGPWGAAPGAGGQIATLES